MESQIKKTFASFGVRNFRLYFIGQGLSRIGTWMQTIALSWLVLQLTHSGTQLGLVIAAQFLPSLLFGLWGGVIADRFDKRKILYIAEAALGLVALAIGLLVVTHEVRIWMVYSLSALFGLATAFEVPARQSFIMEMVGPDKLNNAVTLNAILVNVARVIGPSIAGVLIVTTGVGACFLVNAFTYLALLVALKMMDGSQLFPSPRSHGTTGQIRAGIDYVLAQPTLRSTLLMMFIIGTLTYEFPVILPLFATVTLHGNASTYSAAMAAMGAGAVIGGLYTASRGGSAGKKQLITLAGLMGVSVFILAIMPNFVSALVALVLVGALFVMFVSLGNATLQLTAHPDMRGRVMSLWAIAFQGTTPIGGPIIGFIADHSNPRVGLVIGGIAAVIAAGLGALAGRTKG